MKSDDARVPSLVHQREATGDSQWQDHSQETALLSPRQKAAAASSTAKPFHLRPSHRRVVQLFRTYGPMTDQEALEVAKSEGWDISPSGLRSRRAEVTPDRGRGIRDSGRKRNNSTVWELDPDAADPERLR